MKILYYGKKYSACLYKDFSLGFIDCSMHNFKPAFVGINLGWITITYRVK